LTGKIDQDREVTALYAAVIADVLDELGFREQAMDPAIRPLPGVSRLFGRAFTVRAETTAEIPEEPYRAELEAVDALVDGDVVVAAVEGEHGPSGFWGELLTTAALSRGGRGAVVDGYTRDSEAIAALGYSLFARGSSPLDSKGRSEVIGYGEPVRCGGVLVATGDLVFGDQDGVVVIPEDAAEKVFALALDKVGRESEMRVALRGGMGVIEAYDRFGVL
jgi:4-hydroxy-4-methyl-2-oxoglutarate aldolase